MTTSNVSKIILPKITMNLFCEIFYVSISLAFSMAYLDLFFLHDSELNALTQCTTFFHCLRELREMLYTHRASHFGICRGSLGFHLLNLSFSRKLWIFLDFFFKAWSCPTWLMWVCYTFTLAERYIYKQCIVCFSVIRPIFSFFRAGHFLWRTFHRVVESSVFMVVELWNLK